MSATSRGPVWSRDRPTFAGLVLCLTVLVARALVAQEPLPSCPLPAIEIVPDTMLAHERGEQGAADEWLRLVKPSLLDRFHGMQDEFRAGHDGTTLKQTSGFRATEYQRHFRSLRDLWVLLHDNLQHAAICRVLAQTVEEDLTRHGIARCTEEMAEAALQARRTPCKVGLPFVNKPGESAHEMNPAEAIDVSKRQLRGLISMDLLDGLAARHQLVRVAADDQVHFTESPQRIDSAVLIARFPGPLTVMTPLGGLVPPSTDEAEDGGITAQPIPASVDPQIFDITPVPGIYRLSGTATTRGVLTAHFERYTEHGRLLEVRQITRVVSAGETFTDEFRVPDASVSPEPPIVVAPRPLRTPAADARGIQPVLSSRLAAWLDSATAIDDGLEAPEALPTFVGEQRVTPETRFPVGRTVVRFLFRDSAGNTGEATSIVTVVAKPPSTSSPRSLTSNQPAGQQPAPSPPQRSSPAGQGPSSEGNRSSSRVIAVDWRVVVAALLAIIVVLLALVWNYRNRRGRS